MGPGAVTRAGLDKAIRGRGRGMGRHGQGMGMGRGGRMGNHVRHRVIMRGAGVPAAYQDAKNPLQANSQISRRASSYMRSNAPLVTEPRALGMARPGVSLILNRQISPLSWTSPSQLTHSWPGRLPKVVRLSTRRCPPSRRLCQRRSAGRSSIICVRILANSSTASFLARPPAHVRFHVAPA